MSENRRSPSGQARMGASGRSVAAFDSIQLYNLPTAGVALFGECWEVSEEVPIFLGCNPGKQAHTGSPKVIVWGFFGTVSELFDYLSDYIPTVPVTGPRFVV